MAGNTGKGCIRLRCAEEAQATWFAEVSYRRKFDTDSIGERLKWSDCPGNYTRQRNGRCKPIRGKDMANEPEATFERDPSRWPFRHKAFESSARYGIFRPDLGG